MIETKFINYKCLKMKLDSPDADLSLRVVRLRRSTCLGRAMRDITMTPRPTVAGGISQPGCRLRSSHYPRLQGHLAHEVEASRRKGLSRARQATEVDFAGACRASGGLYLGSDGGPRGGALFLVSEVPL